MKKKIKKKKNVLYRASPCVAAALTAVRKRVCSHPTRHQRRHFVLTKLDKKSSTALRRKNASLNKNHADTLISLKLNVESCKSHADGIDGSNGR